MTERLAEKVLAVLIGIFGGLALVAALSWYLERKKAGRRFTDEEVFAILVWAGIWFIVGFAVGVFFF